MPPAQKALDIAALPVQPNHHHVVVAQHFQLPQTLSTHPAPAKAPDIALALVPKHDNTVIDVCLAGLCDATAA